MSSASDPTGGLAFLARARTFLTDATWERMPMPVQGMDVIAYKGIHPDGWTFTVVSFSSVKVDPQPRRPGDPLVHYDTVHARGYDGAVVSKQDGILCHMTTEFAREAFTTAEKALAQ